MASGSGTAKRKYDRLLEDDEDSPPSYDRAVYRSEETPPSYVDAISTPRQPHEESIADDGRGRLQNIAVTMPAESNDGGDDPSQLQQGYGEDDRSFFWRVCFVISALLFSALVLYCMLDV